MDPGPAARLEDFPLHEEARTGMRPAFPAEQSFPAPTRSAPAGARFFAAAADAAVVVLLTAVVILAARLGGGGRGPRGDGFAWALLFMVYLSLFTTVPPLVLFGRTIGMALSELSVRSDDSGAGMTPAEALRRWAGTLATAATGGLLLLWSRRDPDLPTPADRFSGRPIALE